MSVSPEKLRDDQLAALIAGMNESVRLLKIRYERSAIPEDATEYGEMLWQKQTTLLLATELQSLRSQLSGMTEEASSDLVKRLEEEAERLSGHSIDRGSVDAGIASNLASEAATTIDEALTLVAFWKADAASQTALLRTAESLNARQGEVLKHAIDRLDLFLSTFGDMGERYSTQADIEDWRAALATESSNG